MLFCLMVAARESETHVLRQCVDCKKAVGKEEAMKRRNTTYTEIFFKPVKMSDVLTSGKAETNKPSQRVYNK